jgi:hypothetical protein
MVLARAPSHVTAERLARLLEVRPARLLAYERQWLGGLLSCARRLSRAHACGGSMFCGVVTAAMLPVGQLGSRLLAGLACSRLPGAVVLRQLCCVPARDNTSCALACRVLPWRLWPLA